MTSGAVVIVSGSATLCVAGGWAESVTWKVRAALALLAGVPVSAPVALFRASPAGSVPPASVQE